MKQNLGIIINNNSEFFNFQKKQSRLIVLFLFCLFLPDEYNRKIDNNRRSSR
jgi:hypothetical protein